MTDGTIGGRLNLLQNMRPERDKLVIAEDDQGVWRWEVTSSARPLSKPLARGGPHKTRQECLDDVETLRATLQDIDLVDANAFPDGRRIIPGISFIPNGTPSPLRT
jgi:hypothetical protein